MSFFGSNLKGENKWFTLYSWSLYLFIFSFAIVPITLLNVFIILLILAFYSVCFFFARFKVRQKRYEEIQAIKFLESKFIRDRGYREELMIGIEQIEELYINSEFIDPKGVVKIEEMEEFKLARKRIIHELKQRENPIVSRVVMDEDTGAIIEINEPNLESFQSDNQKTRDTLKSKLFVDKLEDLHAYYVKLYEPKSFSDSQKHEFERMILVTYGDFESLFSFTKESLYVNGYFVNGLVSSGTFIIIDWVGYDLPMVFARFTENEAFKMSNHVLDANSIVFIREKIKNRMIYDFRSFFKRYDSEIEEERALTKAYEDKSLTLFQKLAHQSSSQMQGGQITLDTTPKGIIKLKKIPFIILILGWVGFVAMLIVFFISKTPI